MIEIAEQVIVSAIEVIVSEEEQAVGYEFK